MEITTKFKPGDKVKLVSAFSKSIEDAFWGISKTELLNVCFIIVKVKVFSILNIDDTVDHRLYYDLIPRNPMIATEIPKHIFLNIKDILL